MSLFTPDYYVDRITDLTKEFLDQKGIRGIILDVDNTLTHHNSQQVEQEVLDWLAQRKEDGFRLMIVSNNYEERVKPFAARLGLDYISFGCKPLTKGYTQACRKMGLPKSQVAAVGDQIYTDILGGNLKGVYTILTVPFQLETSRGFRIKRRLEKIHIKKYRRLHPEHKG